MDHIVTSAVVSFAALFTIVNPIGGVAPFLSLTTHMEPAHRRQAAAKAALIAAAMLVAYFLIGHRVLSLFSVSLAAIEVVGGLIVGYTGWHMTVARPIEIPDHPTSEESDIYFYPMAFPLLAGPGAFAVSLGITNRLDSALDFIGWAIGIVAVCIIAWISMRSAGPISKFLGANGIEVLTRIMGLVVLAIAAELVFHGIADHFGLVAID